MKLYGLSCGFWSANPESVDLHVLEHVSRGDADGLYDLCDCHYSPPAGPQPCSERAS